MAYGKRDRLVPFSNGETLYATLTANNVPCDFYVFPNSGHDLLDDPEVSDVYVAEILNYAKTYFGY